MKLADAKLCTECDELYEGQNCPKCGNQGWWLSAWIKPIAAGRLGSEDATRSEMPGYDA